MTEEDLRRKCERNLTIPDPAYGFLLDWRDLGIAIADGKLEGGLTPERACRILGNAELNSAIRGAR